MRRKIAVGTLSLLVVLGLAGVTWGQDGPPPQGPGPGQHQWGGEQRHFDGGDGHRGGEGWGGGMRGGHGMGMEHHGGHGFGGGDHLLRMAENPRVREALGLTNDQVTRLHQIGLDARKASIQTHADMELRHVELGELMRADNPDHDAIMQKLDEINALQGKAEKARVETMLSARSVLTPEQRAKIKTFMEHRGEMEHRPGMGMQRRGGPGMMHPGGGPGSSAPKPPAPPAQQ
jgi:Spy/CpxP family protein refolding chaperone